MDRPPEYLNGWVARWRRRSHMVAWEYYGDGLNKQGFWRHWKYSVACGLHSGFPLCCVAFWLFLYYPLRWVLVDRLNLVTSTEWKMLWGVYRQPERGVGYIRCPRCLSLDRRVEVKPCPAGSH